MGLHTYIHTLSPNGKLKFAKPLPVSTFCFWLIASCKKLSLIQSQKKHKSFRMDLNNILFAKAKKLTIWLSAFYKALKNVCHIIWIMLNRHQKTYLKPLQCNRYRRFMWCFCVVLHRLINCLYLNWLKY